MGDVPFSIILSSTGIITDPTALSKQSPIGFAGSHYNLFGINGLKEFSFSLGGAYQNKPVGIAVSSFGMKLYQETIIKWMTSYQWSPIVRFGFALNVYQLNITGYGQATALGGRISLRATLNPKVEMVCSILNPNQPKIGSINEALPQEFSGGFILRPHPMVIGQISFKQDLDFEISPRFGVLIQPRDNIGIAIGNVTNPDILTGGFILIYNSIKIEIGCLSYGELGLVTYQTGFSYTFLP